jgi:hypothetical protein
MNANGTIKICVRGDQADYTVNGASLAQLMGMVAQLYNRVRGWGHVEIRLGGEDLGWGEEPTDTDVDIVLIVTHTHPTD